MSILIKGMEMPTSCSVCPMLEGDGLDGLCHAASRWLDDECWRWCKYQEGDVDDNRPANCPLVPVPPHGRLIDADALYAVMKKERDRISKDYGDNDEYVQCLTKYAMSMVLSAPTILEAEVEE